MTLHFRTLTWYPGVMTPALVSVYWTFALSFTGEPVLQAEFSAGVPTAPEHKYASKSTTRVCMTSGSWNGESLCFDDAFAFVLRVRTMTPRLKTVSALLSTFTSAEAVGA